MAQIINTNINSLIAQNNLNKSQSSLQTSLTRLSSGLRINSAKDDAAGLAIASRFTTQITGLNQASRNASDGISLAQTTEGALDEVTNNLQRVRELAVQAANSTNSSSDRAALDAEVQQRLAEIDRSATQTSFNGLNVLDGTFGTATFQVGANVGQTVSISLNTSVRTTAIGKTADYVSGTAQYATTSNLGQQGSGVDTTAISSGDVTIAIGTQSAVTVQASVAGSAVGQTAGSAYSKASAINASGIGGLTAQADTTAQYNLGATAVAATESTYNLSVNGVAIYTNYDATAAGAITSDQLVTAINANTGATGVTASYDSVNTRITFNAADGRNIAISQGGTLATNGTTNGIGVNEGTNNAANTTTGTLAAGAGATTAITDVGTVRLTAASNITIGGATPARIGFTATSLALGNSALNTASVTTVANANTTISRVDAALTSVNALRGTLGAIQNRFDSVVATVQSTSQNLTASRSRIQDADFASETANLSRANILQQAGISVLSQANAGAQSVLSLLK